jgi:hypothetical protein
MKYLEYVIIGILLGLLGYVWTDKAVEHRKSRADVEYLTAALARCQALQPDTIHDTAWLTAAIHKPRPRPLPTPPIVEDTTVEPCYLNWYEDTLYFNDITLAYKATTIGTLEDLELSVKNLRPEIVNVPIPCPPPPVLPTVRPSPWSVNVMLGYPLTGYVGGQYDIGTDFGLTGGVMVHSSGAALMGGVRIRIR